MTNSFVSLDVVFPFLRCRGPDKAAPQRAKNALNAAFKHWKTLLNPQGSVRFVRLCFVLGFFKLMFHYNRRIAHNCTVRCDNDDKAILFRSVKYVCSQQTAKDQFEISLVRWPISSMQRAYVKRQSTAKRKRTTDWMVWHLTTKPTILSTFDLTPVKGQIRLLSTGC